MKNTSISLLLLAFLFFIQLNSIQAGKRHTCTKASRNVDACTEEYNPVCGYFSEGCPEGNCPQTYPNRCFACQDSKVNYYYTGQCKQETINCAAALFLAPCSTDFDPVCANVEGEGPKTFENACIGCGEAAYSLMKPGECKNDNNNFCDAQSRSADCTGQESNPVCAAFREGCPEGRCYKTYDNSCSACQDKTVLSWENGACDTEYEVLSCAVALFPTECPDTYEPVCASLPSLESTGDSVMTFPNFCISCRNAASSLARPGECPFSNRVFADPENTPEICTLEIAPVCGYFLEDCPQGACPRTYDSPCAARQDPTVVYFTRGECVEQTISCAVVLLPEECPEDINPVCAGSDDPQTYDNLCVACKTDANGLIKPGPCREN